MTLLASMTSVVVASLLGSLHCVGMCGGLVSFYAGSDSAPRGSRWAAHVAYHLTRLVAYTSLGASAGQVGAVLDLAGRRVGLAEVGAFSAGVAVLCWGAWVLSRRTGRSTLVSLRRAPAARPGLFCRLEVCFATLAHRVRLRPPLWRASALGLSSALLPCGWLYAFVVLAATAGSSGRGALLLAAFWVGTVPALLGLGLGIQRLSQPLRARLPRLSAVLLVVVGLFTIASRWLPARPAEGTSSESVTPSCHANH
jgi:uncharacterized protein